MRPGPPGLLLLAVVCWGGLGAPRAADAMAPEYDPIEPVNRAIFWFNDQLDVRLLEPAAKGWDAVLPGAVKQAIGNFFANLSAPRVALNELLQAKPMAAVSDVWRFGINTTVGLAGFFDPATPLGLKAHQEDFGQTLGRWGLPPGPYLVLPLLGPSYSRAFAGLLGDSMLAVYPLFLDRFILLGAHSVNLVNTRSQLLDEVQHAKAASFDYYVFVRHADEQRRRVLVADGREEPAAERKVAPTQPAESKA